MFLVNKEYIQCFQSWIEYHKGNQYKIQLLVKVQLNPVGIVDNYLEWNSTRVDIEHKWFYCSMLPFLLGKSCKNKHQEQMYID